MAPTQHRLTDPNESHDNLCCIGFTAFPPGRRLASPRGHRPGHDAEDGHLSTGRYSEDGDERSGGVREQLEEILDERIVVLDGSMGALIYTYDLNEADFRGQRFARHPVDLKNCTEALVLSQPKIIEDIHRAYLEAGADIIETDTFNGTGISLEEFQLQNHVDELNRTAAELARRVADEFTRKDPGKPRFVAGSIGPTKQQLSMGIHVEDPGRRDVTFDQMVATYKEQVRALIDGGVDILLPETSFDTLVMKACLVAIEEVFDETGTRLPVMISGTIFDNGRTLSAQPIEAFYYSVSHFDALCASGSTAPSASS